MATPAQWIPPLPAGYEARWDPNQRAYFFINHVTKTTTWQDPRFTSPAQPSFPSQHAAAAQPSPQRTPQQSLNQASMHATTGGQGQNVPMTTKFKQYGSTITQDSASDDDDDDDWEDPADFDKLFASATNEEVKVDLMKLQEIKQAFPTASESLIKSLLEKHHNAVIKTTNDLFNQGHRRVAVQHPPPKINDMLQRLRAMFPEANPGLVEDMLAASENNEKDARKLLEEMGYKPSFPATHRNKSAQGPRQRSPSPAQARQPSPKPVSKEASPVHKPKLSEAQKQKLLRQLQAELPNTDKSVIEMALDVCDYDVERTRNVIGRMTEDTGRPSTSRPVTSHTRRSPSPSPALSPSNLEPVSLFSDDSPSHSSSGSRSRTETSATGTSHATGSSSHTGSSSRSGTSSSGTKTGTGSSSSRPSTGKRTPSPRKTTPTRQGQQHRAKQVTHSSRPSVISSQPQSRDDYVSLNRTQPQGPNPAFRMGPNKELLISEYTLAQGPNSELCMGPDSSRVAGSQGAIGPDRSLQCGPQTRMQEGPSNENLLVTAI